ASGGQALQLLFLRLIDQWCSEDSVRDPAGYLYRAAANEARLWVCDVDEHQTRRLPAGLFSHAASRLRTNFQACRFAAISVGCFSSDRTRRGEYPSAR